MISGIGTGHNRPTAKRTARQCGQFGLCGGRRRREANPTRHHGSRAHVCRVLSDRRAHHSPGRHFVRHR